MFVGILIIAMLIPLESFGETQEFMKMITQQETGDSLEGTLSEEQEKTVALETINGLYKIMVFWEPTEIKPNQIVKIDIQFKDPVAGGLLNNVYYDFMVTKDGEPIKELKSSLAINGITTHTVEFPSSGSFSIMVNVLGIGEFIEPQNEYVFLEITVVPEFPLSTIVVMASVVGIMIALTRFTIITKKYGNIN